MTSKFSVSVTQDNGSWTIHLEGDMLESASFRDVKLPPAQDININFKDLKSINSVGVKNWILWINTFPKDKRFFLHNCPKIIIDQINLFAAFVPPNSVVESFIVPYVNASGDEDRNVLFRRGHEFNGEQVVQPKVVDTRGEPMEMDVVVKRYFSFLKNQKISS